MFAPIPVTSGSTEFQLRCQISLCGRSPEDWPSYDKRCCPVYCSESLRAGPACRLGSTDKGCTATSYIELPQPIPSGNLARTKPNYAAHSSESGWPNASPSSCWIIKYGVFLTLGSYHWLTISSQHCFSTLRHSTYRSLIRPNTLGRGGHIQI